MGQTSRAIGMLMTMGISAGAIALGTGCNTSTPATQANSDGVRSDVTDVRPIEPVQASYQAPLYDRSTNIPTARQPVTVDPVVSSTPSASDDSLASSTSARAIGGKTHTVRRGETLFSIAKATYGDGKAWKRIIAANPGVTPSKLRVGQVLVMPES